MILGTISTYASGTGIGLIVDGESSPTTKKYMFLGSYSPAVGDRVIAEDISGSYVVLGKIVDTPATVAHANTATTASEATHAHSSLLIDNQVSGHDAGYVIFGIKNGDLYFGLDPDTGGSVSMYKLQKA